jgi:putative membrane protein
LIRDAVPEVDLDRLQWESISPRAHWRRLRLWMTLGTIASAGLLFVLGPWSLSLLPLAGLLGWVQGRLLERYTHYALSATAIYFRSGWWTRQMSVARFSKIQTVVSHASPFDRRNRMASVSIDTAGATRIGHSVDIPYLEQAVADALAGRLYGEAVRTDFHW